MIPKNIYLNYVNEEDENKTWSEAPVDVSDCEMMNREYTDLSQVWHDASEEPKFNQWFLAQIGDDAFDTFIMAMDKNQTWRNWSNGINIKRWAYIINLLPKD